LDVGPWIDERIANACLGRHIYDKLEGMLLEKILDGRRVGEVDLPEAEPRKFGQNREPVLL
jgi:hypothetical protein